MWWVFAQVKGTPWDETFSILSILKNLTYVKLYSLLILTKNKAIAPN